MNNRWSKKFLCISNHIRTLEPLSLSSSALMHSPAAQSTQVLMITPCLTAKHSVHLHAVSESQIIA